PRRRPVGGCGGGGEGRGPGGSPARGGPGPPGGPAPTPAAGSTAPQPVLLRIGPISSMTFGASPAGPRRVPPGRDLAANSVAAPARRRSSVLLEGPDHIGRAVCVKPGFRGFHRRPGHFPIP